MPERQDASIDQREKTLPELLYFVDPMCSLGVRFSEPMDLATIDTLGNLTMTTADAVRPNVSGE